MDESNLIFFAWIPAVTPDGETRLISLREALVKAGAYRRINASLPHSTAALLRLLLAVLHRNFGPADVETWEGMWQRGAFDADVLDAYFARWKHRFNLFSTEHPFYQNRHPFVKEKPAQVLLQMIGGGDTFTLFDHVMDTDDFGLTPADAALMLVTAHSFSLAGLAYPQLKLVYTDAPCSRSIVFFVEGRNLFETLMFNLVQYNRETPIPSRRDGEDRPAWEMDDPFLPERTTPLGYLDFLTWQNRRILLIPEKRGNRIVVTRITTAPGLTLDGEVQNPMNHYESVPGRRGEAYHRTKRFTEGHALWRESHALLNRFSEAIEPPEAIKWMAKLVDEGVLPRRWLQLTAYGMSTEPGKAKVNFYRGEGFEFNDRLLTDENLVNTLGTALKYAEDLRRELWSTVTRLATQMIAFDSDKENGRKPDPKDVQNLVAHWNTESLFWSQLELPFYRFLDGLVQEDKSESALQKWNADLCKAVRVAYRGTVNGLGESQKAFKADALTRSRLEYGIKKVFGEISKEGLNA